VLIGSLERRRVAFARHRRAWLDYIHMTGLKVRRRGHVRDTSAK